MKISLMILVLLTMNKTTIGKQVGIIRNSFLRLHPSSNTTIYRSTCNECLCDMFIVVQNLSIVSLNCFSLDNSHVACQLFNEGNYQISSSYQIEGSGNSIFYFVQLPPDHSSIITTINPLTIAKDTTDVIYSTRLMTTRVMAITRAGDPIVGVFNTTAGKSTGGKNGRFASISESPAQAIDNSVSTKYLNFGATGDFHVTANAPGVGTGYYVTPNISSASIAIGLRFSTANDAPNRDPTGVTLEGTNSDALDEGSSWSLIYNGSTGISPTINPGRMIFVAQQNFSNTIAYKSYRLLITSQRGPEWAVQYAEAQIIGYV